MSLFPLFAYISLTRHFLNSLIATKQKLMQVDRWSIVICKYGGNLVYKLFLWPVNCLCDLSLHTRRRLIAQRLIEASKGSPAQRFIATWRCQYFAAFFWPNLVLKFNGVFPEALPTYLKVLWQLDLSVTTDSGRTTVWSYCYSVSWSLRVLYDSVYLACTKKLTCSQLPA